MRESIAKIDLGRNGNFCMEFDGKSIEAGCCNGGYYWEMLSKSDARKLRDWLTEQIDKMEDDAE